jgi:acylpyruvate hydrolase
MGHALPTHPTLFAKFREALIGAHDDIVLPASSHQVDWEAELALVIGTRVRHASANQAADAIAGFTVANDISMRDWQNRSLEWLQGKTWEHATPVGPWLVTPDEVGGTDPDLDIRCEVDGVVRQASRTSELVFSSVDLVAYVSEIVTLEPGDLVLTGTPAGVGHGMDPPTYLAPGQVVRTVIGRIGELENRCRAETP